MTALNDMPTLDEFARAMGIGGGGSSEYHVFGNVKSVNADGSYQVRLNASSVTTRCARCCDADVGDRVLVCVMGSGICAAVGRVGGGAAGFDVLFESDDGEPLEGDISLSASVAGYDYATVFYGKPDGSYGGAKSQSVARPNGKYVVLDQTYWVGGVAQIITMTARLLGSTLSKVNDPRIQNYASGAWSGPMEAEPGRIRIYMVTGHRRIGGWK